MKLAYAAEMQEIDRTAIEDIGIPGVVLMENAGRLTADYLVDYFGNPQGEKVYVFTGPGNNGGDGFVIARHLEQMGAQVVVCLLVDPVSIKGDAAINLSILKKLAVPLHLIREEEDLQEIDITSAFVIVDALFGTGLKRAVKDRFAHTVQLINSAGCPVVAVDIPSGLDSDTGKILGVAVKADLTVTYGVAKPGQFVLPGRDMVGFLERVDIGIPGPVVEQVDLKSTLLEMQSVAFFLPSRVSNSHKGSHGHLLIAAGSLGKTGAAVLCGRGALRVGAGLVSCCVGEKINTIIESALYEAMTIPLAGGEDGSLSINDFNNLMAVMEKKQAMVLGPGLGVADETAGLVERLYEQCSLPLVVDADALNILASKPNLLKNSGKAARVLTPHPGEMARLTGKTSSFVQENRLEVALDFAVKNNVYLVLKGAGTLVISPQGHLAINSSGNPGMAAGGMGDVLSGIIGGLIVQGIGPWQACCLGVFLHGLAADRLAQKVPQGYLAAEVADKLPSVMAEIGKQKKLQ